MSLFASMQLANNALQAQQIGLQVTGQNIANANTPGYIREEAIFQPASVQKSGNLLLGLGVDVTAIQQKVDKLLDQRLRDANSDASSNQTQSQAYQQIESLVGALGDTGLGTSINNFFASINDVLNQPESASIRNLAVLKGKTLAGDIHQLASRVNELRTNLNVQVQQSADDINKLTTQIAKLNIRITQAEGGSVSHSDAVGLRDQRNTALSELSNLIDVKSREQPDGSVTVYSGGDFLVFEGSTQAVKSVGRSDRGQTVDDLKLVNTDAAVSFSSGQVAGLIKARDEIAGGFLDQLNSFSNTLSFEFNRVYSSGQGLNGFDSLTSAAAVSAHEQPLDAAGLTNPPVNGSFQIQVRNKTTGLTQTSNIRIDLNGLDNDTSLDDVVSQLNAVTGISASTTSDGRLKINSRSAEVQFSFSNDTSNLLASLGVNTFFVGNDASALAVNSDVLSDPSKFAASSGGVGNDSANAVKLAKFLDQPLDSKNGASLSGLYDRVVADVTQGSTVTKSAADGAAIYQKTLASQQTAISGVSIDEEAIHMIEYQRAFQASAKFIATIADLLDTLVKL